MFGDIGILLLLTTTKYLMSEGGDNVRVSMNGLINQPVLLSLDMDPSRHVDKVIWNFERDIMALYINGQLDVIKNEFTGRLEILNNGAALRIEHLRLEDKALYTGTVTYTDKTKYIAYYNLSVYEPVPATTIRIAEKTKNSKGCNVTISCSTSTNTSTLSYTWKYRYGGFDYQPYDNPGRDAIHMSLQPEFPDMEVMCIVKNPADQKNVSAQVTCLDLRRADHESGGQGRKYYYALMAFFLVPLIFLGWYYPEMKKKRKKELKTTNPEEINYAELIMPAPTVPNQGTEVDSTAPEEPSDVIVYSTLRHHKV